MSEHGDRNDLAVGKLSEADALFRRLSQEVNRSGFNAWLGAQAVEAGDRHVLIRLPYRDEFGYHLTSPYYHGGILASLIDIAGYAAVAIRFEIPTPTVSLHIDYLAPALGPEVLARADISRLGRVLSRIDVVVTADGTPVALGRGIFLTKEG